MTAPTFTQRCAAIHAAGDRVVPAGALSPIGRVVALLFDRRGEAAFVVWPGTLEAERWPLVDLAPALHLRPKRVVR